jgi:trimethylamine--corrinoid protein Co-methyltransferase
MSGFIPKDIPSEKVERLQMRVMLQRTSKPIIYVTTDLKNTHYTTNMAEIVAGSPDQFQKRPFAVCYINITSPLRHNPESIQKLIYLSRKGIPFIYRPGIVTRGVTTPVTGAGFLAVNNASFLAGVVLSQLIREGTPFIRDACAGGTFDMRYMVGIGSGPEIRGFNEELLHYYGVPGFGFGGSTGSKKVDEQAALEAALTLITSAQAGAQLIHDVGYMENSRTGSLEQLVICDEIISWIKAYMKPLFIDSETLALDEVREVVEEGGDFMGSRNTVKHFREDFYPELLDMQNYDGWVQAGETTLRERANHRVDEILAEPRRNYLNDQQIQAINEIIEE